MNRKTATIEPLFLTAEKHSEITAELETLENETLPEIRHRMAVAYEDGDIPENNPFLTANYDLQIAFKRRNELLGLLARAKLYQADKQIEDTVHIGNTVGLLINGKELTITLVASEEADPTENKISIDSPIGNAVLGKLKGDECTAKTASGDITVTVCAIF